MSAAMTKADRHLRRHTKGAVVKPDSPVDDRGVLDIVNAAILGWKLPAEYAQLVISYFSESALEFAKRHAEGIKDLEHAERQHKENLANKKYHDAFVLYHAMVLGRLSLEVKQTSRQAGARGGSLKGTGGMAPEMEVSKKSLSRRTGVSQKKLTVYENLALHPKVVEQVIVKASSGIQDATIPNVLRAIEGNSKSKKTEAQTKPTSKDRMHKAIQLGRDLANSMDLILDEWKDNDPNLRQDLLQVLAVIAGHYERALKVRVE